MLMLYALLAMAARCNIRPLASCCDNANCNIRIII